MIMNEAQRSSLFEEIESLPKVEGVGPELDAIVREIEAVARKTKSMSMFSITEDMIGNDFYIKLLQKSSNMGVMAAIHKRIDDGKLNDVFLFFVTREESWRIPAYLLMQRAYRDHVWSDGAEFLEGSLLGYSESPQWPAILRSAIPRSGVQGHHVGLREIGRRQPPHLLSETDRRLERGPLRQQRDQVRRHGGIGRRPDPAQARASRRRRSGRRDASLHDGPRTRGLYSDRRRFRRPVHGACFAREAESPSASSRGGPRCADRGRLLSRFACEVEINRLRRGKGDDQCWTVKRLRASPWLRPTPRRRPRTIPGQCPTGQRCSCHSTSTRRAPGPARTRSTPSVSSRSATAAARRARRSPSRCHCSSTA